MIQLTEHKLVNNGSHVEKHIFFLAVADVSSLMLMDTDDSGKPFKHTRVRLKSGGSFSVKESPLEIRNLMSQAL